ncbi:MAG: IS1182 family transposase, partial [Firmicutes bacterium]|nr:IS1182 family transposase [Bacillota bacterium]
VLGRREQQESFFDSEIFSRMVPEDHPLELIRRHVDFSFVEEECRGHYHPDLGRPSFPPEVLFRVLFLEVWANLSDIQVCRELRYNVLYRHFCGIGWDDAVPDDTTLVVFRRRLGDETFHRLFSRVVGQAKDKGLLRGKWAIVDGTQVTAHAAAKTTVRLAREGRKKLLGVLSRHDARLAKELEAFGEPERDSDYADHGRLLAAELDKGRELISRLKDRTEPDLVSLREFYRQVVDSEGPASFSDPDARWGFKRKDEPFLGYKVHVASDETGMATAVKVTPGNEAELPELASLLGDLDREGLRPLHLTADKGYDDSKTRQALLEAGIRPYIPSRYDLGRLKRMGLVYDPRRGTLTCPEGRKATGRTPHKKGGFIYYFSEHDCRDCPSRLCGLGACETRLRVYVNPGVFTHRARGLKKAMRIRKTIERLFGELKVWHRMARARYRGLSRVTIQVLLTLIVANAKKMAKRLQAQSSPSPA